MLSVHDPIERTPAKEILRLAQALEQWPQYAGDQYSATRALEEQVASMLGQQEALLMPTGKMAQQIALRIHGDARPGRTVVAAHGANHLTLWEDANLEVLHGLQVRPVGDRWRLLGTDEVTAAVAASDVSTFLWELPQREIGGELPSWQDLNDQVAAANAAGLATHLDGARIWQTGPFYQRPLHEIGALFDSVYVSLYKDLAAPRGAILAGSSEFIAAARIWYQRLGGTIDEAWPLALLALDGLHRIPPLMPRLVAHARAIAAEIQRTTDATVRPEVPQAAMFHVHLPVGVEAARRAHAELLRGGELGLTMRFRSGPDPLRCSFESTIGPAALDIEPDRVAQAVRRLLALASAS